MCLGHAWYALLARAMISRDDLSDCHIRCQVVELGWGLS